MSQENFNSSIAFAIGAGSHAWLISGGEPLLHPLILPWLYATLTLAKRHGAIVTVLTSGIPLLDNPEVLFNDKKVKLFDFYKFLAEENDHLITQITTDKRFYSTYDRIIENEALLASIPGAAIVKGIDAIIPRGRAKNLTGDNINMYTVNGIKKRKEPSCFNFLLMTRQSKNLSQLILQLELYGKFCTPYIDYKGNIQIGETGECTRVCSVNEALKNPVKVFDKLSITKMCGKCPVYSEQANKLASNFKLI